MLLFPNNKHIYICIYAILLMTNPRFLFALWAVLGELVYFFPSSFSLLIIGLEKNCFKFKEFCCACKSAVYGCVLAVLSQGSGTVMPCPESNSE